MGSYADASLPCDQGFERLGCLKLYQYSMRYQEFRTLTLGNLKTTDNYLRRILEKTLVAINSLFQQQEKRENKFPIIVPSEFFDFLFVWLLDNESIAGPTRGVDTIM